MGPPHTSSRYCLFIARPDRLVKGFLINMVLCSRYNPVTEQVNENLSNPTCLLDVIFLPLPAIILTVLLVLGLMHHGMRSNSATITTEKGGLVEARPSKFKIILHYLDIALAFCEGGMQVLEITRLAISNEGVGLLPITLAGIVVSFLAIIFFQRPHHSPARFAVPLMIYFLLLALMEIVKLALWGAIGNHTLGPSTYRSSDKVGDLAVLLALYVVSFASQLYKWISVRKAQRVNFA